MTVGPVLTPPDQILLPLPTEVPGSWNWAVDVNGTWTIVAQGAAPTDGTPGVSGRIDDRAHVAHRPPVIREGYLQVQPSGQPSD